MNFLTNTYSNYVPTVVDDTVKEQALLAKAQAENYALAKKEFNDTETLIDKVQTAPGGQRYLDKFKDFYSSKLTEAEEEGNYEDFVGKAQDYIKEGYDNYHLKDIIKGRAAFEEDTKVLDESELPQEYKEVIKQENLHNNVGYKINEETGEEEYVPYQRMNMRTFENVPEELNKLITGFKDDKVYERIPGTDTFRINTDIEGFPHLRAGTVVSRNDIIEFAKDYINNNPNLDRAIKDQADIDITKRLLDNKGEFSREDFNASIAKSNPYREGTPNYEAFQNMYLETFDSKLKEAVTELDLTGEKYDPKQLVLGLSKSLKDQALRQVNYQMMANKFGFQKEELKKIELEDPNKEDTSLEIPAISTAGMFGDFVTGNSNTVSALDFNSLYQRRGELVSGLKEKEDKLALWKAEKQKGSTEVTDIDIQGLEAEVNDEKRELDNLNNFSNENAVYSFEKVTGENLSEFKEKDYEEYIKELETFKDKSAFKDIPHEVITGIEAYNELNPESPIKENRALTKEEYNTLIDQSFNLLSKGENNSFINHHNNDIVKKYNRFLEKEGSPLDLHQQYKLFHVANENATQEEKAPYKELRNFESTVGKAIAANYSNYKTLSGNSLEQVLKNKFGDHFTVQGGENFIMFQTPVLGKLAGQLTLKVKAAGNVEDVVIEGVTLDTGNSQADEVISTLAAQTFGNLQQDLLNAASMAPLSSDKAKMLAATNSIVNVTDGTLEEFNKLPLYTAKEGSKFEYNLADRDYEFTTYRKPGEDNNRILTVRDNVTTIVVDSEGNEIERKIGKGILGYHRKDLNKDFKPKKGAKPQYYDVGIEAPLSAIGTDEKGNIFINNSILPYDAGSPSNLIEHLSLESAIERGTLNKSAIEGIETLMPNWEIPFETKSDYNITQNKINNLSSAYTKTKGYTSLTELGVSPSNISTEVGLPFMALNDIGKSKVGKLFRDLESLGLPYMINGLGRDDNNIVPNGADNSTHKNFAAIDLMKNPAAGYLMHLKRTNPKKLQEYGIVRIIDEGKDHTTHIHIEFDKSLLSNTTPVSQQEFNRLINGR